MVSKIQNHAATGAGSYQPVFGGGSVRSATSSVSNELEPTALSASFPAGGAPARRHGQFGGGNLPQGLRSSNNASSSVPVGGAGRKRKQKKSLTSLAEKAAVQESLCDIKKNLSENAILFGAIQESPAPETRGGLGTTAARLARQPTSMLRNLNQAPPAGRGDRSAAFTATAAVATTDEAPKTHPSVASTTGSASSSQQLSHLSSETTSTGGATDCNGSTLLTSASSTSSTSNDRADSELTAKQLQRDIAKDLALEVFREVFEDQKSAFSKEANADMKSLLQKLLSEAERGTASIVQKSLSDAERGTESIVKKLLSEAERKVTEVVERQLTNLSKKSTEVNNAIKKLHAEVITQIKARATTLKAELCTEVDGLMKKWNRVYEKSVNAYDTSVNATANCIKTFTGKSVSSSESPEHDSIKDSKDLQAAGTSSRGRTSKASSSSNDKKRKAPGRTVAESAKKKKKGACISNGNSSKKNKRSSLTPLHLEPVKTEQPSSFFSPQKQESFMTPGRKQVTSMGDENGNGNTNRLHPRVITATKPKTGNEKRLSNPPGKRNELGKENSNKTERNTTTGIKKTTTTKPTSKAPKKRTRGRGRSCSKAFGQGGDFTDVAYNLAERGQTMLTQQSHR